MQHNKGLPTARNTGLSSATGDYILHVDGDDWVEGDMIAKMYTAAIDKNADMVYCDFFLTYEDHERKMSNPDFHSGEDLLKKGFLGGTIKYNVWNKLVRRSLYTDNNISFPDGHPMGEDMTMILVADYCDKVFHLPDALYHYVKTNAQAYSQSISEKSLGDIRFNVKRIENELKDRHGDDLNQQLNWFKLSIKLPFLISSDKSHHTIWKEWYSEANCDAATNKALSVRTRMVQWVGST